MENKVINATVNYSKGIEGSAMPRGPQGPKGDPGKDAEITEVTASVTNTVGIPSVEVTLGGEPTERTIDFAFSNLKGEKGDKGDTGSNEWGSITGDIQNQTDLINLLDGMEGSISALIGGKLDTDLSNITEAGKEVIKENSGAGLEILDIGIAPCGIDETKNERRYLNGQVIQQSQFPDAVQKLKTRTGWGQGGTNTPIAIFMPELVITEEEWQARLAASGKGQVGAFVIDDEAGTVRLPKVANLQGIYDLTKAGLNVEAGLPNIELSSLGSYGRNAYISVEDNGAIALSAISQNINNNGSGTGESISLDYSLKNSIYGNSDTVQQESVQYPFFIQLANSSETQVNIINEIELNNPYTLFDSKYTEAPLYNTSWLQANSAYHSKSVYVTAYEALTVENNTSVEAGDSATLPSGGTYVKRGLAVKLSADEDITDYDFVINTADETFRLPLKTKDAPSTESLPLYFYIGETVQNANLINAGRIAEQLSVKTNLEQAAAASMPGNKYIDLTLADSGAVYTAPAAGWICVHKGAANSGQYLEIINEVSKLGLRCYNAYTASSGQPMKVFLPVNKGDSFKVNYSASLATEYFRFVYPLGGED